MRWKYDIKDAKDKFDAGIYLNEMGDKGWELVTCWSIPMTEYIRIVIKKEITDSRFIPEIPTGLN